MALLWMIVLGLGACASESQAPRLLKVQTLFKSQHCDLLTPTPKLTWLSGVAEWATYRQKLVSDPRIKFDDSFEVPSNENLNGVLIVSLGLKTSGGYDLSLDSRTSFIETSQEANHEMSTLVITVTLTEPAPGSSRIMVMTRPCIGLAVVSENGSDSEVDYLKVISSSTTIFERIHLK